MKYLVKMDYEENRSDSSSMTYSKPDKSSVSFEVNKLSEISDKCIKTFADQEFCCIREEILKELNEFIANTKEDFIELGEFFGDRDSGVYDTTDYSLRMTITLIN